MNVITVSQLNTYISALLSESAPLQNIYISGEISNFLHYTRSGHMYFTLKDEKSQLKCVMFASYSSRIKFTPEDGMNVICRGKVSVYEKDGSYQLYVNDMQPTGLGALNLAYEQLKEKLEKEGLFSDEFKKPIPKYPKKIGVATSNMGAAIEDIKNITKRRFSLAELIIVPTVVQGDAAPESIKKSIETLDKRGDIDVIIVGRGGGSIEDLWGFNSEMVARSVFSCKTPVISAVGHETDFTICDFVADLRAPTPSAAAELAVPDINNERITVDSFYNQLAVSMYTKIDTMKMRLDDIVMNSPLGDIDYFFESKKDAVDTYSERISQAVIMNVERNSSTFETLLTKLNALSPLSVLSRGYAVAKQENKIIKSIADIDKNKQLKLTFSDGTVVIDIKECKNE